MKKCTSCNAELLDDVRFCNYCGSKQEEIQPPEPQRPEPIIKVKRKKKLPIISLIRNSIILAVAILLFVLSWLPVISIEEEFYGLDVNLEVSAQDSVVLLFDSFKSLDEQELLESELFEQMQILMEDFADIDLDNISEEEQEKIDEFLLLTLRLGAQSEDVSTPFSLVLCALISCAYMVASLALLVMAGLNFMCVFGFFMSKKSTIYNVTITLACALPCIILVLYYIMFIGFSGSVLDCSLSANAQEAVALSVAIAIMAMVFRLVCTKRDKKLVIAPRVVAIALSLMVVGLAFAPIMTASLEATFGDSTSEREVKIDMTASFYDNFSISDSTLEEINELVDYTKLEKQEYFEYLVDNGLLALSRSEAEGTLGKQANAQILTELIICKSFDGSHVVISMIYIFFLVAVAGALMVIWQNLRYFAMDKYSVKLVKLGKTLALIGSGVALIATIVVVAMSAVLCSTYLPYDYSVSIGAGVIFFFLFAFGAMFCPSKNNPKDKPEVIIQYSDEVIEITDEF